MKLCLKHVRSTFAEEGATSNEVDTKLIVYERNKEGFTNFLDCLDLNSKGHVELKKKEFKERVTYYDSEGDENNDEEELEEEKVILKEPPKK